MLVNMTFVQKINWKRKAFVINILKSIVLLVINKEKKMGRGEKRRSYFGREDFVPPVSRSSSIKYKEVPLLMNSVVGQF